MIRLAALLLLTPLAGCDQKLAQPPPKSDPGHFALAVDQSGNAWRLNTLSGQMDRCWQGTANQFPPQCFKATDPLP